MEASKVKSYLEVMTNVAVLLVALVVLSAFSWSYFAQKSSPSLKDGLRKGKAMAQLPKLDYSSSSQTLLIAMSTQCHYCAESLPFYRQLVTTQQGNGQATHIVAVFPNTDDEVRQYIEQNHLNIDAIGGVDFRALNISSTPIMVLIDKSGKIRDFWIGKLPESEEQQVVKAVGVPES